MKGSAALAAMIRKKSGVLYGSPGGETLDGTSTTTISDQIPRSPEPAEVKPPKFYQPSVTPFSGANKCCICEKTVYKTEEMIAVGRTWHTSCFTCGGSAGDGCGRVLRRDGYSDHNSQPYCNACSAKVFKPKGYGFGNALHLDNGAAPSAPPAAAPAPASPPPAVKKAVEAFSTPPPPPVPVVKETPPAVPSPAVTSPAAAPQPPKPLPTPVLKDIKSAVQMKEELKPVKYTPKVVKMAFSSIPKCTSCAKSVYKMEEVIAVGRTWHNSCFTCGGTSNLGGCGRVLTRDGYVDHENNPFCMACHSKLFRPKGYGYGNALSTDYGPAPTPAATTSATTVDVTTGMAKLSTTEAVPSALASAPAAPSVSAPAPELKPPAPAAPVPKPAAPAPPAVPAMPATHGPGGTAAASIGATSRAVGGVFKEASYVGDNDEVDEDEWND